MEAEEEEDVLRFWRDWLGFSREALAFFPNPRGQHKGVKDGLNYSADRVIIKSLDELLELKEKNEAAGLPVTLSVQPFLERNKPFAIERLFFEFDNRENPDLAVEEALKFAKTIRYFYNAEPLVCLSGFKGAHVYLWLQKAVEIGEHFDFAKDLYREAQETLLKGLNLKTIDVKVLGDIKRLSRLPYSIHQESGRICQPINLEGKPLKPEEINLGFHMEHGLSLELLEHSSKKIKERIEALKKTSPKRRIKVSGIRPCIQEALNKPLHGGTGHLMRLAIACEYLAAGHTVEDIIPLFMNQNDFDERKTRYFIEHAQRSGYKPFKCEKIRELGYCLGEKCNQPHVHFRLLRVESLEAGDAEYEVEPALLAEIKAVYREVKKTFDQYPESKHWRKNERRNMILGWLGERVFNMVLDQLQIPHVWHHPFIQNELVKGKKPTGADFTVYGETVDVKTSARKEKPIAFFVNYERWLEHQSDILVFIYFSPDLKKCWIAGWLPSSEIKNFTVKKLPFSPGYEIPKIRLKPFSLLLQRWKRGEGG